MSKIYQDGQVYIPGATKELESPIEIISNDSVTYKDIENANKLIKTMPIKRKEKDDKGNWVETIKEYAEVKERIVAFRRIFPTGSITTKIEREENYVQAEAMATDSKGNILAIAHAQEIANKSFSTETAETSAVGRCLGFIGLGISTSIASAEEMQSVEDNNIFDEEIVPIEKLVEEFEKLYSSKDKINILNGLHVTNVKDLGIELLKKYIDYAKKK